MVETKSTQEHTKPVGAPHESGGREAFVVVFPDARALPVPLPNEPFGRDWLAKFNIEDVKASRDHCVLTRSGGSIRAKDNRSRNGTWVNGSKLADGQIVPIDDGAMLRIGRTLMVYRRRLQGPEQPAAPLGELIGPYGLRGVEAALAARLARASPPINVLIHGETGTGKEGLAVEIARRLNRSSSYEAVNMAAVPADTFESKLFGHVRGAFSGAIADAAGVFVAHAKGAVFLDEIGELPLALQPKLLRFLQNRQVEPVGASKSRHVDVVVIAATNRGLTPEYLRDDLVARFETPIELPPLRARKEDIFNIAQGLLKRRGEAFDPRSVEVEAVERLLMNEWRHNVRELDATLKQIAHRDPPPALRVWAVDRVLDERNAAAPSQPSSADVTPEQIDEALARHPNNASAAERALGISHGRMTRHLKSRKKPAG